MPGAFTVCPHAPKHQICGVPRYLLSIVLALSVSSRALAADADMVQFNTVAIKPATAYVVIATISMAMPPFVRQGAQFLSTYSARVFPYYYFNEKGRIWIDVPDEALRRIASGQPIDFTGHAVSDAGERRRVEGHATPTDKSRGYITVRVFVSKRIALNYDTTYECVGTAGPDADLTPKRIR